MATWTIQNDNDARGIPRSVGITPTPDDAASIASYVLAYDTDGNLETVDKTIDGNTFQITLTWTAGLLTAVSTWVEQ